MDAKSFGGKIKQGLDRQRQSLAQTQGRIDVSPARRREVEYIAAIRQAVRQMCFECWLKAQDKAAQPKQ